MQETPAQNPKIESQPIANTTPPTSESQKSFSKGIIIAVVVLVLVIISGASYLLLQNQAKKTQVNTAVIASPTPTPDPTASWKTYEGSDFLIKYPAEFSAGDSGSFGSSVIITNSAGTMGLWIYTKPTD